MLDLFLKFNENDLSKNVIVPLLKKVYNLDRVEFVGGGPEKGRDIIIHNIDSLGFPEIIGVQVKYSKLTANSKINSFQQLINQLSQMIDEGVTDRETAEKIKVKSVVFITPYEINDKVVDSHSGAYKKILDLGVKIIDGPMLWKLINQHSPELLKILKGDKDFISEKFQLKLTNRLLYRALNFNGEHNVKDIYCETSFAIGSNKKSCIYNSEIQCLNNVHYFKLRDYDELMKISRFYIKSVGINIFNQIDSKSLHGKSEEYKSLHSKTDITGNTIQIYMEKLREAIKNSSFINLYPSNYNWDDLEEFLTEGFDTVKLTPDKKLDFYNEIRTIKKQFESFKEKGQVLASLKCLLAPLEEVMELRINTNEISNKFEELKHSTLTFKNIEKHQVAEYLKITKKLEYLSRLPEYFSKNFIIKVTSNNIIKPKINVLDALDTKKNIILIGDAGSGKTTNLQVYAKILYERDSEELTIFATLNEVARCVSQEVPKIKNYDNKILDGLYNYLFNKIDSSLNREELEKHLSQKTTVLIFDSIDESIAEFPWIINSLKEFARIFDNVQIVTSSRFSVENIADLDFINISLLPFTEEQKSNFFTKWFADDAINVSLLMQHLSDNPELDEIVTNPLSATIMATLQASGVALPKNECSLYKKRFELLSGVFDNYKGSKRQKCTSEELIECSRILAYKLHQMKKRELTIENIKINLFDDFDSEDKLNLLIDELISPCEILLINPNGSYGFGHLRFQEYLASEHLDKQNNRNIYKLLKSPWWKDVFILYSHHAYKVEWLINDASSNGYAREVKYLFEEILKNRKEKERTILSSRLEIAYSDESINY